MPAWFLDMFGLESHNCFDHISVKFPSAPIVLNREVFIFLNYVFSFQQHVFGNKPATCKCNTINLDTGARAVTGFFLGLMKKVTLTVSLINRNKI